MQKIGAIGVSIAPRVRSAVRRDNLASVECVQPTRIDSGQYDDPVCDEVFSFDSSFRSRGGFCDRVHACPEAGKIGFGNQLRHPRGAKCRLLVVGIPR